MKKLKFLLFLIPFLFSFNVFAQNVTSSVRCSYNGSGSTYYGDPNDGLNSARCYDLGTRYSPRLGYIEFYLPTSVMSFTAGKSYTVTMNMATNDWRNHIMLQNVRYVNSSGNVITSSPLPSMSNFRFISKKQIKFDFKLPSGTIYPYLRFVISSPTYGNPDPDISSSSYMTGESNWNLSSIDISPVSSSSGGSSGTSPTPTPSPGNQDIINNNNQNTDDIMNNANQNTSDIINNNNQNTQDIIDNQNSIFKDCQQDDVANVRRFVRYSSSINLSIADDHGIDWTGNGVSGILFYQVINVVPNTRYVLSYTRTNVNTDLRAYIYRGSADFSGNAIITGGTSTSLGFDTGTFNQITLAFYSPSSLGVVTYKLRDITLIPSQPICTNKIDDTTNAINDVNDSINNSNVDSDTGTGFFDNFSSQDFGLSQIITIPLNTIQSLTSKSCVPLQVPIPFTNSNISLPCMTEIYETKFSSIYNLWKIVSFGIVAYLIAIDIFHIVKGFKDPESDKVEVLDL